MNSSTERDTYVARCLRVASAARANGVTLTKHEKQPILEVSSNGKSVQFPIVTDDRLWRQTTVEEAFYSVLVDARGWAAADLSDAIVVALTDDVEKGEVNLMKHDLDDERARMAELTAMLGGDDKLAALYTTADLA
jgi:hypothetical protein